MKTAKELQEEINEFIINSKEKQDLDNIIEKLQKKLSKKKMEKELLEMEEKIRLSRITIKECLDLFRDIKSKEELPYKKIEYYRNLNKSTLEKIHKERNEVIDGYVIESIEQSSGYGCYPGNEIIITYTKQWI